MMPQIPLLLVCVKGSTMGSKGRMFGSKQQGRPYVEECTTKLPFLQHWQSLGKYMIDSIFTTVSDRPLPYVSEW